jgi:putative ABC transport system permease protein
MNVLTRGVRNTLRSPLRSGAIAVMLAISIALILAMLVAKASVEAKIEEVKASVATQITVNPAGIQGMMGAGELLTADQLRTIQETENIASTAATLTEQLQSEDTDLESAIKTGEQPGGGQIRIMGPNGQQMSSPPITVTGTNNPEAKIAADKLTGGEMIDGTSSSYEAIVGKNLAEKNELEVGDTFTAYGQTITVAGIYSTDNMFNDNSLVMSLTALQKLADEDGISNVMVTANSSDNVEAIVSSLKEALGDEIDVTSQEDQAENSLAPLTSISGLALTGVIGAAIATGVIILLSMIMIVRERRREIGVIKAIGGTNVKVITQFVTEAMTLTLVGGVGGLGLGVLASGPITQSLVSSSSKDSSTSQGPGRMGGGASSGQGRVAFGGPGGFAGLQTNLNNVTGTLTPEIFFGSIGIILLIAGIGSAIPAYAIARVRPAEVLRAE